MGNGGSCCLILH